MVFKFVTKARHKKFEIQIQNLLIELSIVRKRLDTLEEEVFPEIEGEEDQDFEEE